MGGASATLGTMARIALSRSNAPTIALPTRSRRRGCAPMDVASAIPDGRGQIAPRRQHAPPTLMAPNAPMPAIASAASACASPDSPEMRAKPRCPARMDADRRASAGGGGACASRGSMVMTARSLRAVQRSALRTGCAGACVTSHDLPLRPSRAFSRLLLHSLTFSHFLSPCALLGVCVCAGTGCVTVMPVRPSPPISLPSISTDLPPSLTLHVLPSPLLTPRHLMRGLQVLKATHAS